MHNGQAGIMPAVTAGIYPEDPAFRIMADFLKKSPQLRNQKKLSRIHNQFSSPFYY